MAAIYEMVKCGKCSGTGYIGSYAAILNGICFPCDGKGELRVKVGSSTWHDVLLERYNQKGFCPTFENLEILGSVCMMDDKTAVVKVAKDQDFYYFGQPICGGSGWHKVSSDKVRQFIPAYKKHISNTWKYKPTNLSVLDEITD